MRVRLSFEEPLPPYKCWYEVPASCSTVKDLQRSIRKGFKLDKFCKTTRLDLEGFFLLPASSISGSLNDGDLLQVMIRRKSDILPPRSLPAAGGKKRERDEQEANLDREKSKRQRTRKRPQSQIQKPMDLASSNKHTGKGAASGNQQPRKNNAQFPSKNPQSSSKTTSANSGNQQQKLSQGRIGSVGNGNATQGKQSPKKPDVLPPTKEVDSKSTSNGQQKQRRTVNLPTKQTQANAAPSSSSDSSNDSDSDSSDSDSDSDSSDSDSSDSDDSDSSDSSSGSDSSIEIMTENVFNKTAAPPGAGSASTKGRNARRNARLKESRKKKLAELKAAVSSGASVAEHVASSLVVDSPTKPAPAKVFMTTVKLQDQNPTNRKQNLTRSTVTKTLQPTTTTLVPPHQTSIAAGVESQAVEVSSSKAKSTPNEEDEDEGSRVPRDYESLPKHTGETRVGEVIAFKTLEIGADYSPIISDFKEAKVLKWSEVEKEAEVQLARKFREPIELDDEGRPVMGKFEVYDEEQFEMARRGIVILDMLSLFDCRVVS